LVNARKAMKKGSLLMRMRRQATVWEKLYAKKQKQTKKHL